MDAKAAAVATDGAGLDATSRWQCNCLVQLADQFELHGGLGAYRMATLNRQNREQIGLLVIGSCGSGLKVEGLKPEFNVRYIVNH